MTIPVLDNRDRLGPVRRRAARRVADARRRSAWATAVVIGMLSVGVLSGCASPQPAPTPSVTGFSSEEEAFAAAEATYRAYVEALNNVDLADPSTFEEVYRWTTGDANAEARESFSQMHADGWTVTGDSRFDSMTLSSEPSATPLQAELCLDVSAVEVGDNTGRSVVPASRLDRQPLAVEFAPAGTRTGLAVSKSNAIEADTCN